jgi:hypothetical protein
MPAREADPIESRKWVFPFEISRLQPRAADNYFDESTNRFIEYPITISGVNQTRRINFWQYVPSKSEQPYLYFDTSRRQPEAQYDPPAATALTGLGEDEDGDSIPDGLHVHSIKRRSESAGAAVAIQSATPDKFQILHAGIDEAWGIPAFEQMSLHSVPPGDLLVYPDGPFTGDIADTIVNFSEGTLEASQP